MKITIDGRVVEVNPTDTILAAAKKAGIEIPTLCFDKRFDPYASCFICVVEVEGARVFVPACASRVRDGMVVHANSDKIKQIRKMCLELLLSDHSGDCFAPCKMTCPAGIDIQGYVAHIANGNYDEALQLIKDRNPLPLICGSVCPHPCEKECRRNLIDEAVAVNPLKRFVAEMDLEKEEPYLPQCAPDNGKKIAIIGAGPAGLTAAYYLMVLGYYVKIFEMNDKPGGMLRYGIPEYRLPKKKLDKEIGLILKLGADIEYNKKLGRDFSIADLKEKMGFDAVFLGLGAWNAYELGLPGDKHPSIVGGIKFLKDVIDEKIKKLTGRVAVVGGGNTAMDCARTSLRLGADKVTIVYRRSRKEMPAEDYEIEEAMQEGIEFLFLTNPTKVITEGDKLKGLELIKMKLGEPDASGRRKPIPDAGSEFTREFDLVIPAISQFPDLSGIDIEPCKIKLTKWGTFDVNQETMQTSCPYVFAGGDVESGAATAIKAIAAGRRSAFAIDQYLSGKLLVETRDEKLFNISKGDLKTLDKKWFNEQEKKKRAHPKMMAPEERNKSFKQCESCLTITQAKEEAKRCLSCGCIDVFGCKLREYTIQYDAKWDAITGAKHDTIADTSNGYIIHDVGKCIKCTGCIRVCTNHIGASAFGLGKRGFDTTVVPTAGSTLAKSTCIACGNCVVACPTGALSLVTMHTSKPGPFKTDIVKTNCEICQLHCDIDAHYTHDELLFVVPQNEGINGAPCKRGVFDYEKYIGKKYETALHVANGKSEEISPEKALYAIRQTMSDSTCKFIVSQSVSKEEQEEFASFAKRHNAEPYYFQTKHIFSSHMLPEKVDIVAVFGNRIASKAPAVTNRILSKYPEAKIVYLNEPDFIFGNKNITTYAFQKELQFQLANELSFSKMETKLPGISETFFKDKKVLALIPYDPIYREVAQMLCMNSSVYMKCIDVDAPYYRLPRIKDLEETQLVKDDTLVLYLSGDEDLSNLPDVKNMIVFSPARFDVKQKDSIQFPVAGKFGASRTYVELLGDEITVKGLGKTVQENTSVAMLKKL